MNNSDQDPQAASKEKPTPQKDRSETRQSDNSGKAAQAHDVTVGDEAQKRREKMKRQGKAEGD